MCKHITFSAAHHERRRGGVTHTCFLCGHDLSTGQLGDYYGAVRDCSVCFPKQLPGSKDLKSLIGGLRAVAQLRPKRIEIGNSIFEISFECWSAIKFYLAEIQHNSPDGSDTRPEEIRLLASHCEACEQCREVQ